MKKILTVLAIALAATFSALPVLADGETRKVCVDIKDKEGKPVKDKDGKTKQNCKEVKVHKKLEDAEKVPEPKKK
jgi:hypothetical protein